ncbi:unnamed protein product [Caenorhabditis sp. 36 PRJEB53466]|nr:unnamed protein product [Caenorhabditis sp. 36 PRJEB53466]
MWNSSNCTNNYRFSSIMANMTTQAIIDKVVLAIRNCSTPKDSDCKSFIADIKSTCIFLPREKLETCTNVTNAAGEIVCKANKTIAGCAYFPIKVDPIIIPSTRTLPISTISTRIPTAVTEESANIILFVAIGVAVFLLLAAIGAGIFFWLKKRNGGAAPTTDRAESKSSKEEAKNAAVEA